MKPSKRVDLFLHTSGYVYERPYYFSRKSACRLEAAIMFSRHRYGLGLQSMIYYRASTGRLIGISPLELTYHYNDGRVSGALGAADMAGFWDSKDMDLILSELSTSIFPHLSTLMDARFVIDVYNYLMGEEAHSREVLDVFPGLGAAGVVRRVTPLRLIAKAAYLNVASQFEEARMLMLEMPSGKDILIDANAGIAASRQPV